MIFLWILGIFIFLAVLLVSLYYLGLLSYTKTTILYALIYGGYIGYVIYAVYSTMDFETEERLPLGPSGENTNQTLFGDFLNNFLPDSPAPAIRRTPRMTEIYTRDVKAIIEAYTLGFRLEMGEPTETWILNARSKLERLGPKKYYKILQENNKIRIDALVTSEIILHTEDTMSELIYNYNSFDLIESLEDNHLYVYSRHEWPWILEKKICPFTRTPISDMVLKTIESRNYIVKLLPRIITLGDGILSENTSAQSSARSEIHKLHNASYLPTVPMVPMVPINPLFGVNQSEPSPRTDFANVAIINSERINSQ